MTIGSIICGVDDSESVKGAARAARDLEQQTQLRPVFVRVVEPGSADEKISAIAERLRAPERAHDRGRLRRRLAR